MQNTKENLNKTTINEWILNRETEIEKEKAEFSQYVQLQQGENKIQIDVNFPPEKKPSGFTDKNGKPTDKWIYTTTTIKNGKALKLSASKILDRQIITALTKGITEITIIKIGTGKDTRYSIKELT